MALCTIESDAQIESSFRRLLSSIEAEREKIRDTRQQIAQERESTTTELERLQHDTEEWCNNERSKIDSEWKRLDRLSEKMSGLWPETTEILQINCSGRMFTIPRSTLCSIEGSQLSRMFSDAHVGGVPRDSEDRYFLDFNPVCFGVVVDYLNNRRLRPDAPTPIIPAEQQQSMDFLAEALQLKPFLKENNISTVHGTSLSVVGRTIESTHPGWQVISAERPLPMAGVAYFEVKILHNPDVRGGLAVGLCGHVPQGAEVHSIRLSHAVLYNSNNGIIGDCIAQHDVAKGIQLSAGAVLGVKHDISSRSLMWYHNHAQIGCVSLKPESLEHMESLYPVFALYVPGQKLQVEFNAAQSLSLVERGGG